MTKNNRKSRQGPSGFSFSIAPDTAATPVTGLRIVAESPGNFGMTEHSASFTRGSREMFAQTT
jgi:hypothetical protein